MRKKFEELTGLNGHFVQDNISKSSYGVLRGLHLQKDETCSGKISFLSRRKEYGILQ